MIYTTIGGVLLICISMTYMKYVRKHNSKCKYKSQMICFSEVSVILLLLLLLSFLWIFIVPFVFIGIIIYCFIYNIPINDVINGIKEVWS